MKKYLCLAVLFCFSVNAMAQFNIDFRSLVQYNKRASNLWGYADSAGREYALIGLTDELSIVDITNPDSPAVVQSIPGPSSTWREVRTWGQYAYVTNETGNGLLIIDLRNLPNSAPYKYETFGGELFTAHTVFADEQGFAYLFGYNDSLRSIGTDQRGAYIIDLRTDPWNPTYAGKYSTAYVHDGFVRNDTLWSSQIYAGNFAVVDVSTKASPTALYQQETPSRFTHNSWLTDDGQTLLTTDEVSGAFITFYDVSDLENITETDRYQLKPGSGLIPHNAYWVGDYVVASYYKEGVIILDATKKNNVIAVGQFDTSPFIASDGFNGCWGVAPYLPSGNLIASDIEEGLFVLTPTYQRACYVEGNITQSGNSSNLGNVKVDVLGTENFSITNFDGNYYTGVGTAGNYDVRFTRAGCGTRIFSDVALTQGQTLILDAALECQNLTGIDDANLPQPYLTAKPSVFNGQTSLNFFTGEAGIALSYLSIYDMNGRLVSQWDFETPMGEVVIGDNLPSGVYLVTLSNPSYSHSIKIVKN